MQYLSNPINMQRFVCRYVWKVQVCTNTILLHLDYIFTKITTFCSAANGGATYWTSCCRLTSLHIKKLINPPWVCCLYLALWLITNKISFSHTLRSHSYRRKMTVKSIFNKRHIFLHATQLKRCNEIDLRRGNLLRPPLLQFRYRAIGMGTHNEMGKFVVNQTSRADRRRRWANYLHPAGCYFITINHKCYKFLFTVIVS